MITGHVAPTEDQQQDASLVYAMERDGRTIISYSRKRDTGDANQDLTLKVSIKLLKCDLQLRRKVLPLLAIFPTYSDITAFIYVKE